ncbi:MAG: cell wall metabolism sensor histidine kinase WalK [Geobacteraceae bacterium]|nr:cell wall metabolism sensor histidine kinase WalK [Geobacteraceae bacterium]
MKITLERRIILFSFIILFLTILANSGMDIVGFRRDYVNALVLRSQSLGTSMKGSVEKVLGLGLDLRELSDISEKCRELVQGSPEIAYCLITDLDGTTLFANDPAYRSLRTNSIISSYTMSDKHRVNLIGDQVRYFDSATPVISPDGKTVASVHVGFREEIVNDKVAKMVVRSVFVLLIFFLLSFSLVVFFVKKGIMQPISALLNGVKKISEGSFDTVIGKMPVYEFNKLAETINFMSASLKNREEEIQKNYQELESTHNDLHDSYIKLESLSLELEKSEELYKSLMEDSSDAIVVIGGGERVMMVNKMAEEFFGYAAREIVGLPLTKFLLLLNIENIPKIHRVFSDAIKGVHVVEELQFVNKDETVVLGRVYASSIKSSGERLVQAIFRDITKENEILRNLEKSAADLARLNKMKDSFLGLASHELKTPLTVIMGYAELISTDMAERVDKTVLEMVQNISNAAVRLDNIVKDMVDVSMIDEKKLQLKLEGVNLNRLVEDSVNELRFFFSMRRQELHLNLDETIPAIKGDNLRLLQLLSNILGNAIKFTPDGGTIAISTGVKYLLRSKQPELSGHGQPVVNIGKDRHMYVEVAINDTGIGIDREDQLRIFDKFYEVGNIEEHSSGKVAFKAKGAGLGLAIAKGIVEMHGGEIWVESPGYDAERYPGSTFHVLLPLDPLIGDATLDYMNLLR